jgi:hypothetical protein
VTKGTAQSSRKICAQRPRAVCTLLGGNRIEENAAMKKVLGYAAMAALVMLLSSEGVAPVAAGMRYGAKNRTCQYGANGTINHRRGPQYGH